MEINDITTSGYEQSILNTHFVFNTLNIIQHYIILNDKKAALLSLNKFSKLFRQYLLLSQSKAASIDQEINLIRLYLQLQVLRYTNKITYQLICDNSLQFSKNIPVIQLAVIIDDLIESLLKKGERKMHLLVRFSEDSDKVLLILEVGDFNATNFHEAGDSERIWEETGIQWKKHLNRFNCTNHYQVYYSEEKVIPGNISFNGYKWRVMIYLPVIT
jgi:LytS/YehU family sensor histidine kinase